MIKRNIKGIIGSSEIIKETILSAEKFVNSNVNLLISGETGTGKKLFAEAIHKAGKNKNGPFVVINCANLTFPLFESEFFGHVRGAFTGANTTEIGIVESAKNGTLVFDKVEFLPLDLQQKLIDFVEKKEFRQVGGRAIRKIDLRLIFTTQKNLFEEIENKKMLDAFYYRISIAFLRIPPLRKRKNDIPLLADSLIKKNAEKFGYKTNLISSLAVLKLMEYDFPGNIRELENIMIQSSLNSDKSVINVDDLSLRITGNNVVDKLTEGKENIPGLSNLKKGVPISLDNELKKIEKVLIEEALDITGGQRNEASKMLSITDRSMRYRIDSLGIKK